MLPRVRERKLAAFAVVGVSTVIGLVVLTVVAEPAIPVHDAKLGTAEKLTSNEDSSAPNAIHVALLGDRLDDASEPSLDLGEAVSRTRLDLYLPDPEVTGRVVKVVPNETVEDPRHEGRIGLMVLYESGVKLIVEPGARDLKSHNEMLRGGLPFRDGRESSYASLTVAGRPALVREFGVQYQGDAEIAVPASIIWNMGEVTYRLRASVEGPREAQNRGLSKNPRPQSIGVDELTRIAESMAPASERL